MFRKIEMIGSPKWHDLGPDVGGYYSCHVTVSGEFTVITTPISLADKTVVYQELLDKIKALEDQ